jgi:hypothetical protein
MYCVFISDHMKFSGGRKLMFDYAAFMKKQGHKCDVIVEEERGDLAGTIEVKVVPSLSKEYLPKCDLIIASDPREVKQAHQAKCGKVVHFCQGFEITDLEERISGKVLPPRFEKKGFKNQLILFKKRITWRHKLRLFESIYRMPSHLITISIHLKEILEKKIWSLS